LPAGEDQLIPLSWQPVPGAPGAEIYPYIRKLDTVSSNSYLIRIPGALILIDPGGLADQAAMLFELIADSRLEGDRQVFVILTHAHVDHFAGIQGLPACAPSSAVTFMIQETGAAALEQCDQRLTQADLFNIRVFPLHTGFPLLTRDRAGLPGVPVEMCTPGGQTCILESSPSGTGDRVLNHERLSFASGHSLEFFHTPGHSPDSICIRIGRLLFIGDLVFAANPGIAGLVGWSQESLIRSLSGISALLAGSDITLVCPGHGRIIPAPDAERMLESVRIQACSLANIAEFDRGRALMAAGYAEDCMEQVNELFAVMAGRLYYVSYIMDELEESELADETGSLFNGDRIDELLEAFQAFAEEHHQGNHVSIHLALKAGQVMGRLERLFNSDELADIIDPTLVERAGRLLSDYSTLLRGYTPPDERSVCDLVPLIRALVTGLSVPLSPDEDLLLSTDDEVAFARILRERIGSRPLLEDVALAMGELPETLPADIDRVHLSDLLTYILEDLVGTGSDTLRLDAESRDHAAVITLAGNAPHGVLPRQKKTMRFLRGLCERAGGNLLCIYEHGDQVFRVTFPACGQDEP
jgi:glyoxylase-like metal-dependent hydrolase (beta-lactamase superfamily II)